MSNINDTNADASPSDYAFAAAILGAGMIAASVLQCKYFSNNCDAELSLLLLQSGSVVLLIASALYMVPKMLAFAARENQRVNDLGASVLPGYRLGSPTGSQLTFKITAGDYPVHNAKAFLLADGISFPVEMTEAVKPEVRNLSLRGADCFYKFYPFAQIAGMVTIVDGQPRSLMSVLGAGAAGAMFNPLIALGAGTAVGTRKDQAIVAIECRDGRRVLTQIKSTDMAKLEFALGKYARPA